VEQNPGKDFSGRLVAIDQIRTFYSCLYRALFFPNKLYELDASGKVVHYSPYNGQVLPGYMFAGTGFWDTFRALYPFLNLVFPSINKEMQEGLVNDFKESGWLPEWSSPRSAKCDDRKTIQLQLLQMLISKDCVDTISKLYMKRYFTEQIMKAP
jgi:putative alpha-1,2-mannosidase